MVTKDKRKLKAIIIKGNPKYINNTIAKGYYKSIETFLKENGVSVVEYDPGNQFTIPKLDADIFVAHSRGCERKQYMPKDKQSVFLKFGDPDGVIHPVDLKWQKEVWTKDTDLQPPPEHFLFTQDQKKAILTILDKLSKSTSLESFKQVPAFFQWN